jgi:hypothetical protein
MDVMWYAHQDSGDVTEIDERTADLGFVHELP